MPERAPSLRRVPMIEALQWFLQRVPMPAAEARRLTAQAKRQAFWVSHVVRLDLISTVFEALESAVDAGLSLEDFQRSVADELLEEWRGTVKNPAHRLETIYRTNMQHAYQAGRHKQMTDPDILRAAPWWMYDSVLDLNTTELCRGLNGTIKRYDDPFWEQFFPPNHYNCRSGTRTLTPRQADARGGETATPDLAPQDGFDAAPTAGEWRPDLSKYPPRVVAAFRRATGGAT